ncbi:DUF411 domain-containing protein [Natronoarchaeum rubrum]|uniref:DUF411 domain-containing protein n=1 Tax=Natronoarchaeum rubrum TaxID=755311 RepID=UPI002112707C|nr:DUF411 domain-containing protein [Natronoarchaeum rubrum]
MMTRHRTRRRFLRAGATVGLIGVTGCLGISDSTQQDADVAIPAANARQYSAPGCGCCGNYAEYLRDALDGDLAETVSEDVDAVKREHGIPDRLRSCHTLVVDEYVVEGHVPAETIATLIEERPSIDGIALPGMPAGSPGMGGEKSEPFVVYAFGGDRIDEVFETV